MADEPATESDAADVAQSRGPSRGARREPPPIERRRPICARAR